jgi:hypothetical protein
MNSPEPFRAFVSYCHADAAFAAWLQRKLETYRLPKRLADRVPPLAGQPPGRLGPVFRDRADLSAAEDLSEAVRQAIARSSALVVVASPDGARSHWVEREIHLFRESHPGAPILVALARGKPADALPPALLAADAEPLAADFQPDGDGKRLAFLKIVAGLAALPLDALVQRDAQRRLWRVTAVTLGALVLTLTMAAIMVIALLARAQAVRERNHAEGLIEFMLTDLRDQLRGVGRLDVMQDVNTRAMDYYTSQGDPSQLPEDSKRRRALVRLGLGEDYGRRDLAAKARAEFEAAYAVTSALLERRPNEVSRIFAHAQSVYWVGYADWQADDWDNARTHFTRYDELAQQLLAADPRNKNWLIEAANAQSNLGTLALRVDERPDVARAAFSRSVEYFEDARELAPNDRRLLRGLADAHGWLADSVRDLGRLEDAYAERLEERRLLDTLVAAEPLNAELRRDLVGSSVGLARLEVRLGKTALALARMRSAKTTIDWLAQLDPTDKPIARQQATVTVRLASLLDGSGVTGDRSILGQAQRHCASPGAATWNADLQQFCSELRRREGGGRLH